jgi:hypothetical protein
MTDATVRCRCCAPEENTSLCTLGDPTSLRKGAVVATVSKADLTLFCVVAVYAIIIRLLINIVTRVSFAVYKKLLLPYDY